MVVPSNISLFLTALVLTVTILYFRRRFARAYPPGPRGLPFIGAALSMPKDREWITYSLWKAKYGPIVGLKVFGQRIVILNTSELAHELLDNRSAIYSDRPPFPMLEMMGYTHWNIGVMPYGHRMRLSRKLLLQSLSPQAVPQYRKMQQQEVSLLLGRLLVSPTNFIWHLRRTNTGQIMQVFYGHQIQEQGEDSFVKLNDDVIFASSRAGSPGAYFVNTFPMLKHWPGWLPGGGFKRDAEQGRILAEELYDLPMKMLEQKAAAGNLVQCFVSDHLQDSNSPEHKAAARAAATTSYGAGVETSTSTFLTFVLAMVLYPDAQRRAQDEIDRVIPNRLPTLNDRDADRLPFISAILTECYRWAPPGTFGLPHRLTTEDCIEGFTLPAGTIVMSNIWSILHEESTYVRPMDFLPERYLDNKTIEDPRAHVFGYGRRVCPGRNLAEGMLWLGIASILATFDISPEVDEAGRPIIPIVDFTSGVMSRPKDFRCRIRPRSSTAQELIMQGQM